MKAPATTKPQQSRSRSEMRSVTSTSDAVWPPTYTLPASDVPAVAEGITVARSVLTSAFVDATFGACFGVTMTTAALYPGLGIGGDTDATSASLPMAATSFSTSAISAVAFAGSGCGSDIST